MNAALLKMDNIIAQSISIFEASSIEEKISIIDRFVKTSKPSDQRKILTHIFQIIQKQERQKSKELQEKEFTRSKQQDMQTPTYTIECKICGAKVPTDEILALHMRAAHGSATHGQATDKRSVPIDISFNERP